MVKMKKNSKKLIAPIIITVIICLYYIGFAILCIMVNIPLLIKILGGVIPLILAGVCIYVLVERIKEIRSGEEDDLSQY